MAELFKNLASTTLAEDLTDAETDVDVASAMGFSGGTFRILVDSEIMKVTGVSGTTLTVVRGQEGTPATAHSNGAAVKHILTAGALDAHDQNDLAAYDTFANRPAAGTPGRIFLPTDGIFLERDNGSIWEKFGPIWPMTPPLAADFPRWFNQGTSTFLDNKGAAFSEWVHDHLGQSSWSREGLSHPAVHGGNGVRDQRLAQQHQRLHRRACDPRFDQHEAHHLRHRW